MIKYNINYDSRTVTAYFEGGRRYWEMSLLDMTDKITSDLDYYFYMADVRKIVEDYQMSATVRCHPKDIFNEEVGKKLAKKKLNERFNRCKMRVLRTLADYANKEYNILMKRIVEKAKKGVWHE